MKLRAYQSALSLDARKCLADNNSIILQLSTGGGKTRIATDIVDRAVVKDITTVFLADRIEILNQTVKHFNSLGISCQMITADTKTIYKSKVYVGMVESFYRRYCKGMFNGIDIGLFIFDEAHISSYYKLIKRLEEEKKTPYIIGLTATPVASSKNYTLKKYYKDIVCGPSTRWLVENGHLLPSVDIGSSKVLDLDVMAGEFSTESQAKQFKNNDIDKKMFALWKQHAQSRQTLCYNINIEHNNSVRDLFDFYGYDVAAVSSDTPKDEREEILYKYAKGEIQIICNVGILTKGYDSPHTGCIIANFSTASTSKWYQVVGRGGRTFEGLNDFITIDMGNNILRHGSYNDEVDWKQIFLDDKRDKNFKVKQNVKLCPVCYAYLFNIHVPECHVCNNKITLKELISLEKLIPEELKDKDPKSMTISELYQYAKFKGYKAGWAWNINIANTARRQHERQSGTTTQT